MIKTKTLKESGPEKLQISSSIIVRENITFQFLSQQCIQPLNIDFSSQDKCGCFYPSAINQVQELISNLYYLS
jgi:hypothetical protein